MHSIWTTQIADTHMTQGVVASPAFDGDFVNVCDGGFGLHAYDGVPRFMDGRAPVYTFVRSAGLFFWSC